MAFERGGAEQIVVVDETAVFVEMLENFFPDDAFFDVESEKKRLFVDAGEQIERPLEARRRTGDRERAALRAGAGDERSTQRLEGERLFVGCRVPGDPAIQHVLEQMA